MFTLSVLCFCSFSIMDLNDENEVNRFQKTTIEPDGKALYKTFSCGSCHGKKGKSFVSKPADLTNPKLTLEKRIEIITNGSKNNPKMIAFGSTLSKQEVQAIAKYTMTFIKK